MKVSTFAIPKLESLDTNLIFDIDEFVPSSNPDSPLLVSEFWSELEEEVTDYVVQSLSIAREDFVRDKVEDGEFNAFAHAFCNIYKYISINGFLIYLIWKFIFTSQAIGRAKYT